MMRFFSKKKVVEEKPVEEEKQPRVFYLDVMNKIGKIGERNHRTKDETLAWLFPRKASDMKLVKNGKRVAMDRDFLKPAMYNNDLPEEMLPFFTHTFIGWQACALLYENAYIKKACEIPARDAVAVDYELQYENKDGDEDDSTDKKKEQEILNKLKKKTDKEMRMKDLVRNADIFRKVYGQILAVPTFNVDMKKVMEKPYDPSKVKKGTYTGMTLIQPFWVTYQMSIDGVANPQMAGYYEPEYYVINATTKIHKSWIIKLITGVCPDILKPVYYYGGIPLTQQIYERVFCAEKTANEAPKLALTKRLLIVDGNVENLAANPAEAYNALESVLSVRDNMGVMVKNPADQVQQIDTSLGDMDTLIMTQFQLVAAIAEMPVTKLMKTQLKGLNNSGDYEMKDYSQTLIETQENVFNRILERHYQMLSMSEYGKDLGIQVVWNPIDTPTELEVAQIESQQAQTDSTYIASGVVGAEEVRNSLRANKDSRFHNLSEDMPEMPMMEEESEEEESGEGMDSDDDIEWITVKGNHIPIKKGENKGEAIKEFFESKKTGEKSPQKAEKKSEGSGNSAKAGTKSEGKKEFMPKKEFEAVHKNVKKILSKAVLEEPKITRDLKSIKGIEFDGLDYRLKTTKSAVEKVKRERIENPYKEKWSDRKIMRQMYDLVRYTQVVDKDTFVEQARKTLDTLKKKGYKIVQLKNFWRPEVNKGSNPYRGINMKLLSPNGQKVELQFNTRNNLKVKADMHEIYNQQRELKPESQEWKELNEKSLGLTKRFDNPKGIEDLVA